MGQIITWWLHGRKNRSRTLRPLHQPLHIDKKIIYLNHKFTSHFIAKNAKRNIFIYLMKTVFKFHLIVKIYIAEVVYQLKLRQVFHLLSKALAILARCRFLDRAIDDSNPDCSSMLYRWAGHLIRIASVDWAVNQYQAGTSSWRVFVQCY